MRIRKKLMLTVVAPIALIVIVAGALWYNAKDQIGLVAARLGSMADIRYGWLFASPFGSVSIDGVRVVPLSTYTTINIDKMRVQAPNALDFYRLYRAYYDGDDLPNALRISARGITSGSDGSLFQALGVPPLLGEWLTLACGHVNSLGLDEMAALGYAQPVSDATLSYRFEPGKQLLTVDLEAGTRGMFALSMRLYLPIVATTLNRRALEQAFNRLEGGSFSLEDFSFNSRRNEFCAQINNQSTAEFVVEHTRAVLAKLDSRGITPSPNLAAAYRQYAAGASRLFIGVDPNSVIELDELPWQDLAGNIGQLGVEVYVNDQPVENLALAFNQVPAPTQVTSPAQLPQTAPVTAARENPPHQALLVDIAPQQASRHIGKTALLQSKGKQYQGLLLNVADQALQLQVTMRGGKVVYSFPFNDIYDLQVYD